MSELAVVDKIDADFLLLEDDFGDAAFQLLLVSRLVELFAERALLRDFDELRRPRQAADMRG